MSQTDKPEARHRLTAILAADAAGYSRLMSEDERVTLAALDAARKVFRTQIESQGGRVVDTAGDSVLASFETATGAVSAAIAIQRKLSTRLRFRIGVHLGDVLEKTDGSVYGDGVNVSARLQAMCEPGSVMISHAVHAAVPSRIRNQFEDAGEHKAKNIADPVRAFRMRVRTAATASSSAAVSDADSLKRFTPPGAPPALVGREADLAALDHLLAQHRHVTVLGAGGIGKTSLALAAAHARRHAQRDGAAWVDLSSIFQPTLVYATVAHALRLPAARQDDPLPALMAGLKSLAVLLVLDNAEHLIDEVARLADAIAAGAPSVLLLVTSQVPLKVAQERVFRLGALPIPEVGSPACDALKYGAVELFVDQARAADAAFELTDENVATVIELCRHLDGLALAIKLAAARLALFGLHGLEQRLGERLKLLIGVSRSAPTRQQTLHAALEWSYGLLSAGEQATFRRLAVFAGACGFSLELAREVAGEAGQDEWTVIEHVSALHERSFVVGDGADPPRYRLLESARAYALHQLAESQELRPAEEKFARTMNSLMERFDEARWTVPDKTLMGAYGHELDNVRLAIEWAVQQDAHLATSLVGASSSFFLMLGLLHEHRRCAETLEPMIPSGTPDAITARYWLARALAGTQEASPSARAGEKAANLFRALGDEQGLARALCCLGLLQIYSAAQWSATRSEMDTLSPQAWPARTKIWRYMAEASMLMKEERHAEALESAEAGLLLVWSGGFLNTAPYVTAQALAAELALGRFEDALRRARDAIADERRWRGTALEFTLGQYAAVLTRQGRGAEARLALAEFTEASRRSGWSLFGLFGNSFVELALHEQRHSSAARLLGYALAAWKRHGTQRRSAELLVMLENVLDPASLGRLLAEGKALDEEAVCALALSTLTGDEQRAANRS